MDKQKWFIVGEVRVIGRDFELEDEISYLEEVYNE